MPLFQSITNFFNGPSSNNNTRHASRKSALTSTFDAFSLPTTHNDRGSGFGTRMGNGMDPTESASSSPGPSRRTSFAPYPPPKDTYNPSGTSYPPLSHTFHRLRNALVDSFPELIETLNSPVNPALLSTFEHDLGCPLPRAVRDSFLEVNGQDSSSFASTSVAGSGGIFFGLTLLPIEEVIREWTFWRMAEHDPSAGTNPVVLATMASIPPGWIKSLYACRGWIPLLSDGSGNYVGVDLDPDHLGTWGQVILFGRDFDRKCVLFRGEGEGGWGRWLSTFVDDLESGENWESVDKSTSSDEEDELGYSSYNGGQSYGESGSGGIKLSGEYRGWNVLEAWWDRSVRKWEELGMGLDVESIERGLEEARRLAGEGKGKEREENNGLGLGMGMGTSSAQVEIPVIGSPYLPAHPSTPVPGDDAALLPPSSPDPSTIIPTIHHPEPPPRGVRIITPTPLSSTTEHPLRQSHSLSQSGQKSGLLSPPSSSPPARYSRTMKSQPPAPTPIDLPTRQDVQAAEAVARAEQSGLRGGWVMNLDTSSSTRRPMRNSKVESAEMEEIDLEGGKLERFGSPVNIDETSEDRTTGLAMGLNQISLSNMIARTPSPLSREASLDGVGRQAVPIKSRLSQEQSGYELNEEPEKTPRADGSGFADASNIRLPPPVTIRTNGATDRERRSTSTEVDPESDNESTTRIPHIRSRIREQSYDNPRDRMERESSVISMDSQDGLLGSNAGSVAGSRRTSLGPGQFDTGLAGGGVGVGLGVGMERGDSLSSSNGGERGEIMLDHGRRRGRGKRASEGLEDVDLG